MGPVDMIARDLGEMGYFGILVVGLPVVSAVLVALGRRLAAVPLLLSAGIGVIWFLYYAREWPNPGIAGFWPAWSTVVVGWGLLGVAEAWHRRRATGEDRT